MPQFDLIQEKRNFTDKYGFAETFDELEKKGRTTALAFKHLDSFLSTSDGISFESREYMHTLNYMLNKYINDKLEPNTDSQKDYSLKNFDVMEFIKKYEEIAQMKHEVENPGKPRVPYAGMELKILKDTVSLTESLAKPLHEIWADKIKNGIYSFTQFRDNANMMRNLGGLSHAKTAVLMQKTMEKITSERSFGWKLWPGNWPQWYRESKCMNQLTEIVDNYRRGGRVNIDQISSDTQETVMDLRVSESVESYRLQRVSEKLAKANANKEPEKVGMSVKEAAPDAVGKDVVVQEKHDPAKQLDNKNTVRK
jgi:hypothetical protein